MRIDVSLLVPAYNEAGTIGLSLERCIEAIRASQQNCQLIVVDDGSVDDTTAIANEVLKDKFADGSYQVLRYEVNRGKGYAIRQGLPLCAGEYVIIHDADLEYDPNDIFTYLGGQLVTKVTNLLYGQRLTDEPTCYKLFKRELLLSFDLECEGFEFCPEVTAKAALRGIKIKEIPISYFPRLVDEGKKISWRDGITAITTLLKYRFRKKSHESK